MAASTPVTFRPFFYSLPFLMNNINLHRHGIVRLLQLLLLLLLLSAAIPYTTAQSNARPSQHDDGVSQPLAIVVVIFVCLVFVLGFFSIYIRSCCENRSGENSQRFYAYAAAAWNRPRWSPRGLDPSVIESFPIFVYSAVKHLKIGKGSLQCAVCISEFEDSETLLLLPKCDHVFHADCIEAWLVSHSTCPVCRSYLEPSPGDKPHRIESIDSPEGQNHRSELNSEEQDHVSINVQENQTRDSLVINEIINTGQSTSKQNQQRAVEKFPRSHSTGHSLVQPGETSGSERYTLRLPGEVRKQMVSKRLKRTTSSVGGYCRSGGGEESNWLSHEWSDRVGRSDQWLFLMMPPFFSRTGGRPSKVGCNEDVPLEEISVTTSDQAEYP